MHSKLSYDPKPTPPFPVYLVSSSEPVGKRSFHQRWYLTHFSLSSPLSLSLQNCSAVKLKHLLTSLPSRDARVTIWERQAWDEERARSEQPAAWRAPLSASFESHWGTCKRTCVGTATPPPPPSCLGLTVDGDLVRDRGSASAEGRAQAGFWHCTGQKLEKTQARAVFYSQTVKAPSVLRLIRINSLL